MHTSVHPLMHIALLDRWLEMHVVQILYHPNPKEANCDKHDSHIIRVAVVCTEAANVNFGPVSLQCTSHDLAQSTNGL